MRGAVMAMFPNEAIEDCRPLWSFSSDLPQTLQVPTKIGRMRLSVFVRAVCVLCAGLVIFGIEQWHRQAGAGGAMLPAIAPAVWPASQTSAQTGTWVLEAQGPIPMPPHTLAAHASNLLAMPPQHPAALTAFWFAGDRESAPNVQIAASQWDRRGQQWTPAKFVVNRHAVAEKLGYGIRRLGNPVAWLDGDGRLHLFVVATGFGGWAASRILQLQQSTGTNELVFEPVRVLPLSWWWNISYLVRNPPLNLADGGMVLPVHFELGRKFASALRFDRQGQLLGMVRISLQGDRLQPALVMQSPTAWWALMRVQRPSGKIAVAHTTDAGLHWNDLPDLTLDNPDAAVAGLGIHIGQAVLAYNPSASGRTTLKLAESANGVDWSEVSILGKGEGAAEFSYPAVAWADNKLWVSYTVDRTHIAWKSFARSRIAGESP
ncbi:MAG: hypothetical protein CFE44_01080 [Burkholderiales bacterium PBB4]|nr:MAG: hypothetical protein CFE44_01080 [Burkholderiales bacterium PBB4]